MVATPWLVVVSLLALPLWVAPPIALLLAVTRSRRQRVGFGAALIVLLTLLYAILVDWVTHPGLPMWAEGALLWGPVTLLVCGLAWLVDRRQPDGAVAGVRHGATRWLVAGFGVWSLCCGTGLLTPAAGFVDLRLDSPRPGMVLPLPDGLTLLSAERDCGSEQCIEVYLIGSPGAADSAEVTERLWTHLVEAKGWQRLRDDAGCVRYGWLLRHEFCGFASSDPDQPGGTLRLLVSGAVAVTPTALAGVSGGVGTVGAW